MFLHRRKFFAQVSPSLLLSPSVLLSQSAPEAPKPQDGALVNEWVTKAHQRKLEPMKELLAKEGNLIQASWDWGGGDWETALEAAAHTGSREMAEFLLGAGARPSLFAATMLGDLAAVKALVEGRAKGALVRGAHGIPLLSHAIAGGTAAAEVFEYLLGAGVDVNAVANSGMSALAQAAQAGNRGAVRRLLEKAADPNLRAKNGATALSLSLKGGYSEIAADLRAAGAKD